MSLVDASPRSSVDPEEVARFSALAEKWWDPKGEFAPLHKFNPTRLTFIRDQAAVRSSGSSARVVSMWINASNCCGSSAWK